MRMSDLGGVIYLKGMNDEIAALPYIGKIGLHGMRRKPFFVLEIIVESG